MPTKTIRVATRKSALAMCQTELTIAHLKSQEPGWSFEIIPMSTQGDERLKWSLEKEGGKGLFTSELERAIIEHKADLAVHSAKDLPTEMTAGIALAGYLKRAPVEDVLIVRAGIQVPSVIATSSPRRRGQLKKIFPKAIWKEVRGNVQTRLTKIADGYADATIMAQAGLHRLGIDSFEGLRFIPLPVRTSVPAAGQGAIALQTREEDIPMFAPHLCEATKRAVDTERIVLSMLGGGCHSASAVHYNNGKLHLFHELRGYLEFSKSTEKPFTTENLESLLGKALS